MGWEATTGEAREGELEGATTRDAGAGGLGGIHGTWWGSDIAEQEALEKYRADWAAEGRRDFIESTYSNRTFFFYSASILNHNFEYTTGLINSVFSTGAKELSFTPAITENLRWDYYKIFSLIQTHTYNIQSGAKFSTLYESGLPEYLFQDLLEAALEKQETPGFGEGISTELRTLTGKTVEVNDYDYLYDYEFGGTEVVDSGYAIELPPGAIGIIGQYQAPIITKAGHEPHGGVAAVPEYNTDHANETVLTNNSSDIGFTFYEDIEDNPSAVDIPDGLERYTGCDISTNAEEEGFLKSVFGYNEADNFADSLSNQIDNLTSRLYGMLSVDRTAYTRTKPPSLKAENLQEFGGTEASFAPGLTASLGTEMTYGREL